LTISLQIKKIKTVVRQTKNKRSFYKQTTKMSSKQTMTLFVFLSYLMGHTVALTAFSFMGVHMHLRLERGSAFAESSCRESVICHGTFSKGRSRAIVMSIGKVSTAKKGGGLKQIIDSLVELKGEMRGLKEYMDTRFTGLDRKFAGLYEDSLRSTGIAVVGSSFVMSSYVRNLDDLVSRVADGKNPNLRQDMLEGRLAAAKKMAKVLQPSISPLVRGLFAFMSTQVAGNVSLCASIDQIRKDVADNNMVQAVGLMINVADKFGMEQWKRLLTRLKKGLKKDAIKQLRACDGPGVMLAGVMSMAEIWRDENGYAGPDYVGEYLKHVKNPFVEFSEEVEFDMQGKILLLKKHATIEVGEIKPSLDQLPTAKTQLVYRCALLLWAVRTIFPGLYDSTELIGHIFVPRNNSDQDRLPQVGTGGVSFFVHRV
jgi:hypothetical protein